MDLKIGRIFRMGIFGWSFLIVCVYATVITIFCFVRNPLPFPDRGHRCFAVPSEKAAKTVVRILGNLGLPERFTFDAGPTHQTLLWDNTTVIISHSHDPTSEEAKLPPNGLSVVVSNPKERAREAAAMLTQAGFTATVRENVIPEAGDKFALLESNAFNGWVLVFRRHLVVMGKPPNQRKLLD